MNKSDRLLQLSVETNRENFMMRNKNNSKSEIGPNSGTHKQKQDFYKTKSENIRRCPHCNYCWRSHQSISSISKCRRCEKSLDEISQESKSDLLEKSNNSNSANITASQPSQPNEFTFNSVKVKRKLPPIPSTLEMNDNKHATPISGSKPLQFLNDFSMSSLFNSTQSSNFQEKSDQKASPETSAENKTMLENLNDFINKAFKSIETSRSQSRLKAQKSISNQEIFPSSKKDQQQPNLHLENQNSLLTVDNDEPLVEINLNKNFYMRREQQLKKVSSRAYSQSEQNLENSEVESIKRVLLYTNPKETGLKFNEPDSSSRRPSIGLGIQISACQKLSELSDQESAAVVSSIEPDGIIKKFNVSICEGDEIMQIDGITLRNKSEQEIEHIIDESCQLNNGEIELLVRRRSTSSNTSINLERTNSDQTSECALISNETESTSSNEISDPIRSLTLNMNSQFEHLKLESSQMEKAYDTNITKHPNKLDLGKFRESNKHTQIWNIPSTNSEKYQQIDKIKNEPTEQSEQTTNALKREEDDRKKLEIRKDAKTPIIEINKPIKKTNNFVSNSNKTLGEIEV
jgi:hypothetical protein